MTTRAPLPTEVLVTGTVNFVKFYDCRKTKEILPRHACHPGSNWLNQMKTIGVAMGDHNAKMKFAGDDFGIEVTGEEMRMAGEVIALLDELQENNIVVSYSLVLSDDDQMFPING